MASRFQSPPPPLFWHLCFQYFTPKVLCAFDLRVSVNHCFSILCSLARKVFRTNDLQVKYSEIRTYPIRTSSLPTTERVLKDRVPPPEQRTGGAGDWLPRSQCTTGCGLYSA